MSLLYCMTVPPVVQRIVGIPLLYQGEHLQLECHVTGIPDPLLEWYFNREPVVESNNGRITFPEHGKLSVKFVTNKDEGKLFTMLTAVFIDSCIHLTVVSIDSCIH